MSKQVKKRKARKITNAYHSKDVKIAQIAGKEKTCTTKIRFSSQVRAISQTLYLQDRFGYTYKVYFCKYCKGWHLTKKR